MVVIFIHSCDLGFLFFYAGLIFSGGHMWRQQRRFAVATLKYFGVGKKTLENSILQECQIVCKTFQTERGQGGGILFNVIIKSLCASN